MRCYKHDTKENSLRSEVNQEQKKSRFKDYQYHKVWNQPGFPSKSPVLSQRSHAMKLLQRSSF